MFRRSNVQLDILPVQLNSIEQLECVKQLGVFIDSVHVEHLLTVCNQRLYLLSQLRKQGLSDKCIAVVYDAIVFSKVLYAVSQNWNFEVVSGCHHGPSWVNHCSHYLWVAVVDFWNLWLELRYWWMPHWVLMSADGFHLCLSWYLMALGFPQH